MTIHPKVCVPARAQSSEETWLDLSQADFPVGQPSGEEGEPSAASTARIHPPPHCVQESRHLYLTRAWFVPPGCVNSHYSLWQEVSRGPGRLLSVSISVVYYAH